MRSCNSFTYSVRLCWVWYRYPSVGLPMMHVLVVTHLFSWDVDSNFITFFARWTTEPGLVPCPEPLVSHLRYASQVTPTRSHGLCPGNYRPYQGHSRQYRHNSSYHPKKGYPCRAAVSLWGQSNFNSIYFVPQTRIYINCAVLKGLSELNPKMSNPKGLPCMYVVYLWRKYVLRDKKKNQVRSAPS